MSSFNMKSPVIIKLEDSQAIATLRLSSDAECTVFLKASLGFVRQATFYTPWSRALTVNLLHMATNQFIALTERSTDATVAGILVSTCKVTV